jgi:hypothetical protein
MIMTKLLLSVLAALLLLTGCSHGYILTMSNGERVRTASKPRLVNGFYYFKDAGGHEARPVFSASVSEIAPASMASKESGSSFKPMQSK